MNSQIQDLNVIPPGGSDPLSELDGAASVLIPFDLVFEDPDLDMSSKFLLHGSDDTIP